MSTVDLKSAPFFLTEEQFQWVERTRDSLTTEEKIGQLFCVMGGDYPPETLEALVREGKVGGVLFRPTMTTQEVREAYAPLDTAAKVPLLKAANLEEGGSGGASDGTFFGWPMLSGATSDTETARRLGAVCGAEGAAAGLNWTFSPVCDLSLNPQNPIVNVRSFGSEPEKVAAMAGAYLDGLQAYGVAACAKHFPGDGVDYRDQHLHPTVNSLSAADWYKSYGAVYQELIDHGLLSVMVGHIAAPHVARDADPTLSVRECYQPASLSRALLTGVLRDRLGFNGLITTDATIMGGYTMAMERRRAIPTSIAAGCDMIVFTTDLEEDISFLREGVESGVVTQERLDEAVTRVLALKAKVCAPRPDIEPVPARMWKREAADRAITLVKNTQPGVLPATPERCPQIRLILLGNDRILDGSVREIAESYLKKRGFTVEVYDPFADGLHGTAQLPTGQLTLYLVNCETASNQTAVRLNWCPKHALDIPRFVEEEPTVFVSLANPYHLQDVPSVKTYINAYSASRDAIELVIDKLMGKSEFQGVSPVDAFCGLADTRL